MSRPHKVARWVSLDNVSQDNSFISLIEYIEQLRQELIKSSKTEIEILESLRLGTTDYDFKSVKIIKIGGQGTVFEIKSNVDGKTYVGKRL